MKISRVVFMMSLVASAGVHLAVFQTNGPAHSAPSGGDVAGTVAIGASFANLVQGRVEPVKAETTPLSEPDLPVLQSTEATVTSPATAAPLVAPAKLKSVIAAPRVQAIAAVSTTDLLEPVPDEPERKPTPKKKVEKTPQGNAPVNASAGQVAGKTQGQKADANAATKTTAQAVGQKALSSYQNKLLKKIRRAAQRTKSGGAEGVAVVGLQIATNGALTGVRIVKASGNPAVDKTAQKAVAKAAPFAPPPNQAPMTVNVVVKISG